MTLLGSVISVLLPVAACKTVGSDYPVADACTGRPGTSRSGGGGAGFWTPEKRKFGARNCSSSTVHLPSFCIWRMGVSSWARETVPPERSEERRVGKEGGTGEGEVRCRG